MKKLEEMISHFCIEDIKERLADHVGKYFDKIWPDVKKDLEEGDIDTKEEILSNWLDIDTCRVCTNCGTIMEEGWYLDSLGYACSDKCCMELCDITKEEYDRYGIYKEDILAYLKDHNDERDIEDISKDEIDDIINKIFDDVNYYYTEW